MAKVRIAQGLTVTIARIFCPGCDQSHGLAVRPTTDDRPSWEFNGDVEKPTFSPSLHCNPPGKYHVTSHPICHSFIRDGQIQYLTDTTHELSGQTIDLPDYPEEWT